MEEEYKREVLDILLVYLARMLLLRKNMREKRKARKRLKKRIRDMGEA